ncbi:MAG: hypothetical protein KAU10_07150 [Dehalococcoidia bacterium]|nr:hypothetical protein [Dehalococcoidia bacterium]
MSSIVTDTYCFNCDEPIYNEDTANRKPCPNCGSKKRKYSVEASITASGSVSATARLFRPASAFLDIAHELAASNERMDWNLSVISAMVACEIATEKTIVHVARVTGKESLVEQHRKKDKTFKMQGCGARKLYLELTGDNIEQPGDEWAAFRQAGDQRNDIVHEGEQKDQGNAKRCLEVATKFIKRLEKHKAKAMP